MIKNLLRAISLSIVAMTFTANEAQAQRQAMFELYGTDSTQIVMLGNSLTAGAEWNELLKKPNVVNRGIVGDDAPAILRRIECVTAGHPQKIFLMFGVNDISHDLSADSVCKDVTRLIDTIMAQTPDTKLYIQSCLPCNNSFGRYKTMIGKEQTIRDLNVLLRREAEKRGLTFIDIHQAFCDEEGNLKKEWTSDGLHLLAPAYETWRDLILPYINE